jgi:hypothetical protein
MDASSNMNEILVLGDSHTPIFNHPAFRRHFPDIIFNVVTVIGATASGLENPNTKTQAYPIFKKALNQSVANHVIIMLGEVDTGFVIWYRANKYQESVSVMMERAITSYGNFLKEVSKRFDVVCISTPLPTIQDDNDWGDVANARKEVTASLSERTSLTLQFNRYIQSFCDQHSISYLMLDGECIGQDGVISNQLVNSDPNNHHYDPDSYSQLLIKNLATLL